MSAEQAMQAMAGMQQQLAVVPERNEAQDKIS